MIRDVKFQWGLLMLAAGLYLWLPVWTAWHGINSNDFKHIYFGMKALLDGNSPYPIQSLHHQAALQGYRQISLNPYVYLPFTGHAMAFLAPLNLPQAVAVWFALNHIFAFASVYILSQMFTRWRTGAAALMIFSLSLSMPFYRTLTAGQLNMALLFMLCLAWQQLHKQHPVRCGAILAFAALYKLMPAIYGLHFLLRRKLRAAAAMFLSGVLLLAVSVAAAGPGKYLDFLPVLRQMGYGKSTWPHVFSFWDDPPNQSLNSFFTHIMAPNDHTTPWLLLNQGWANGWTTGTTLLLISAYIVTNRRKMETPSEGAVTRTDDASWCATLILALLIPSLMWDHYLVMLLMPVAWMVRFAISAKQYKALVAVIACYILTCVPWNFHATAWQEGAGIILMSLKLWPTLILFGLSLCFVVWSGKGFPAGKDSPPGTPLDDKTGD